jgi:hypothetical protein
MPEDDPLWLPTRNQLLGRALKREKPMSHVLTPSEVDALFENDHEIDWKLVAFEVGFDLLLLVGFLASLNSPVISVS